MKAGATLCSKLLKIQRAVRGLDRDASGSSYRYVSGSKLLGIVRPMMDELGLLLKQEVVEIRNERQDYTVSNGTKPKFEILTTLRMRFTWIDSESGERETCEFAANGQNDWDKGVGSALTYGERYFLLKFFHIATDEDDCDAIDAQRAEEQAEAFRVEEEYSELIRRLYTRATKADVQAFYKAELNSLPVSLHKRFANDCTNYGKTLQQ